MSSFYRKKRNWSRYDEADKTTESVKRANLGDAIGVYTAVLFHMKWFSLPCMQTNNSPPRNYGILNQQYYVGKRENNLRFTAPLVMHIQKLNDKICAWWPLPWLWLINKRVKRPAVARIHVLMECKTQSDITHALTRVVPNNPQGGGGGYSLSCILKPISLKTFVPQTAVITLWTFALLYKLDVTYMLVNLISRPLVTFV